MITFWILFLGAFIGGGIGFSASFKTEGLDLLKDIVGGVCFGLIVASMVAAVVRTW